jgi:type I restriction enzyme R subunit
MTGGFAERDIEHAALEWLGALGYATGAGADLAPDGPASERESYADVILVGRLARAIDKLNPAIPAEARADALKQVLRTDYPNLIEENRRCHELVTLGVPVQFHGEDGVLTSDHVRLVDFDEPDANDWLAVNQVTVIENRATRRADVVVFLNGLPVAVIELKNAGSGTATLAGAFNQLQTYKGDVPSLFRTNAALVISDGLSARIGSLTASRERFMPWRTVDGESLAAAGTAELETLLAGVFEKSRFLALLKDFIVFADRSDGLAKILAGYHQFHAVRRAVACTVAASDPSGDRRVGVIWHTQGSGKSLLMAFYAGLLGRHPAMKNPTLVVLTDRNDLDDQLFATFAACTGLLRQTPVQANSREHMRALLDKAAGGIIFTTLQKFQPFGDEVRLPVLTSRRNVVVIADEAHRSQYGFTARIDRLTGTVSYGLAKHLRDALPNASFIGFTGTPIETDDASTRTVFGDYIDVYDISRAVEDGATVPIYYESRLARVELDEEERPKIDAEVAALTEEAGEGEERKSDRLVHIEAVVGADKRLALVAEDLVRHVDARFAALDGKAIVVCMSRRICVALYDKLVRLRPAWHSDDDNAGALKVVMTGGAADPPEWQRHIGPRPKARRELLAKRIKDPDDALRIVIVRDMWLTGFDAPSLHTMYVDKPMKGHGLMQAIARVNRVFRDKPAGLVVDYIGIAQNLKEALGQYSGADQGQTGIDERVAADLMLEKHQAVRDIFRPGMAGGFDYRPALAEGATARERLAIMAGALDWVLSVQQDAAAKATGDEEKKRAHRLYADAVLQLTRAFALAAASDEAARIRDEVGFFQAIRVALGKSTAGGNGFGRSRADRELAIQQIVSRAVVSTEIIDILRAGGIDTPDVSILSDQFLAEVREMDRKNLALEALRKLLNGAVHAQSQRNVTQAKKFLEQLEAAIARYHANAITTVEVLEELIRLAKDIRAARARGAESGLSDEEIAFYDALAENESAYAVMGEPNLRVIAHELLIAIRGNVTVDWMHRQAARARLRVLVKRILRKHGYPPDLQDAAVQNVLRQAEALSAQMAAAQAAAG